MIFVLAALPTAAGCDRARTRGPSGATTTSASMRPEARTAHPRTVDAAGFVDNAGRTSNETVRTEASGMRATETGSEVPTGTPGVGFPIPLEPSPSEFESGERPGPRGTEPSTPTGAPSEAIAGRLAQALCDRENACGHVGANKSWPSLATCTSGMHPVVRNHLAESACPDGHDLASVSTCLSAIRLEGCDRRVDSVGAVPECAGRSLCLQR